MASLDLKGKFPTVTFSKGEQTYFRESAEIIISKKRGNANVSERAMSEMGEAAVNAIMENLDMDRFWSKGRFHYDFSNRVGSQRLEVKTRKRYEPDINDLDVRLDAKEQRAATESTHLVPVIYEEEKGIYTVTSPGVIDTAKFIHCSGILHKDKTPFDFRLKMPCLRSLWKVVFQYKKDFGYQTWKDYSKVWQTGF